MPDTRSRFLHALNITVPIIQAPMAGVDSPEMAMAVSHAGGLGSLACAMLSPDDIRAAWQTIRAGTQKPVNLNFFCHTPAEDTAAQQTRWKEYLAPYYQELGIDAATITPAAARAPFDDRFCAVIEELRPPVVSFHFGLPAPDLLARVKASGAYVLSSATTVDEALWLERNGCDAIIAQGIAAGGHRATFLSPDTTDQPDTRTLLEGILRHVSVPVIAAGGIAHAQDITAALAQGAAAVQLGTAYLFCPEARISPLYRQALCGNGDTAVTNLFSGRPARGLVNRFIREAGPLSPHAPAFPHAAALVAPLRQASERAGSPDFMQMWSGTTRQPHTMDAATLTTFLYKGIKTVDQR